MEFSELFETESEFVIWMIKKAFVKKRWLERVRKLCKFKQSILGIFLALIPIVILYFLVEWQGNLLYVYPTLWMVLWGCYLILTKRNFLYEMWLDDYKKK